MPTLERLRADHGPSVLAFELENRGYFATSISDRGDTYFEQFTENFDELLAEQEAGTSAFHVLVDDDGAVVGRFNIYDLKDGRATVGYRVAQRAAGHGVATATVQALCVVAEGLGLRTLTAATADQNVASQRVLVKSGFVWDGPADPAEIGGKQGSRFRRDLAVVSE